jgi:uncharacterized protein YqeY
MNTKENLEIALRNALRSNNEIEKRTIRMILSNIKFAEIEQRSALTEQGILNVLQKEIKSRNESIADAEKANRIDLIKDSQDEIEIVKRFLPTQMSDEELKLLIEQTITEAEVSNITEMGKVMKLIIPKIQGKATNDRVSLLVRKLLGG